MAQSTRNTNKPVQDRPSELDAFFAADRGRTLTLCEGELEGILEILAHPEPPTEELRKAWAEYKEFAAKNPYSGW